MKLVVNDIKAGKSYQKEVEKTQEAQVLGKKIGDQVDGAVIGLEGYTLQITGGTDKAGFPMTRQLPGIRRTEMLLRQGAVGIRKLRRGVAVKKIVRGSTVTADVQQLNAKVATFGAKPLDQYGFVSTPKEQKEAKGKSSPKKKK